MALDLQGKAPVGAPYIANSSYHCWEPLYARPNLAATQAGDALAAAMATGYEGGSLFIDPTELGATIKLHYVSPADAENAFKAISDAIDVAIRRKPL